MGGGGTLQARPQPQSWEVSSLCPTATSAGPSSSHRSPKGPMDQNRTAGSPSLHSEPYSPPASDAPPYPERFDLSPRLPSPSPGLLSGCSPFCAVNQVIFFLLLQTLQWLSTPPTSPDNLNSDPDTSGTIWSLIPFPALGLLTSVLSSPCSQSCTRHPPAFAHAVLS